MKNKGLNKQTKNVQAIMIGRSVEGRVYTKQLIFLQRNYKYNGFMCIRKPINEITIKIADLMMSFNFFTSSEIILPPPIPALIEPQKILNCNSSRCLPIIQPFYSNTLNPLSLSGVHKNRVKYIVIWYFLSAHGTPL